MKNASLQQKARKGLQRMLRAGAWTRCHRPSPRRPSCSAPGTRAHPALEGRTWLYLQASGPLLRVPRPLPERGGETAEGPLPSYLQHEGARPDGEAALGGRATRQLHGGNLLVGVVQGQGQRPRSSQAHVPEAEEGRPAEVAEGQDRRGGRLFLGPGAPRPRFRGAPLPAVAPPTPGRHGGLWDQRAAPSRPCRNAHRVLSGSCGELKRIRPLSLAIAGTRERSWAHRLANWKQEQTAQVLCCV